MVRVKRALARKTRIPPAIEEEAKPLPQPKVALGRGPLPEDLHRVLSEIIACGHLATYLREPLTLGPEGFPRLVRFARRTRDIRAGLRSEAASLLRELNGGSAQEDRRKVAASSLADNFRQQVRLVKVSGRFALEDVRKADVDVRRAPLQWEPRATELDVGTESLPQLASALLTSHPRYGRSHANSLMDRAKLIARSSEIDKSLSALPPPSSTRLRETDVFGDAQVRRSHWVREQQIIAQQLAALDVKLRREQYELIRAFELG